MFGPAMGLPLLSGVGGSDASTLWRPRGWHSATENPIWLQEKKKKKAALGHGNPVTVILGWSPVLVIHSHCILPTCCLSPISPCVSTAISLSPNTRAFFCLSSHFLKFDRNLWTRASRTAGPRLSARQLLGQPRAALFPPLFTRF